MKKNVLHIVRKKSQLRASFIKNQILNHKEYIPTVFALVDEVKSIDGGFAKLDYLDLNYLSFYDSHDFFDKISFKILKTISNSIAEKIKEYVKKNNIHLIHFHYGTDAAIFFPGLNDVKIPKVVQFYGYDCSGFPKRFFGLAKYFLKFKTFKNCDKIFAMSNDMRNDLLNLGCPNDKVLIHYYGTDTKIFFCKRNYQVKSKINFIIISGLTPQKGHIFLLKAFYMAHKINNNIELKIVGDGESKQIIIDYINRFNMHNYVKLLDYVSYASKTHLNYLKSSDVFIHPSVTDSNGDKEGIPGAIVEAMANGLPIISTYHAGIPYVIKNNETGILVDEYNHDQLADAIINLSKDFKLRKNIAQKGQLYALKHLDIKQKQIELENIYNSLL